MRQTVVRYHIAQQIRSLKLRPSTAPDSRLILDALTLHVPGGSGTRTTLTHFFVIKPLILRRPAHKVQAVQTSSRAVHSRDGSAVLFIDLPVLFWLEQTNYRMKSLNSCSATTC